MPMDRHPVNRQEHINIIERHIKVGQLNCYHPSLKVGLHFPKPEVDTHTFTPNGESKPPVKFYGYKIVCYGKNVDISGCKNNEIYGIGLK